jgi:hypothetical protein
VSRSRIKQRPLDRKRLLSYAHEQLAIWEVLHRFGFLADDIYAAFYNDGELFTTLKVDGKEWNAGISHTRKVPPDQYIPIYTAECERWNSTSEGERRTIFDKYMSPSRMIQIAISIKAKDIFIPALPDAPAAEDVAVLQAYMEGRLVVVDAVDPELASLVQGLPN